MPALAKYGSGRGMSTSEVIVIGGGLAGTEAAWQLAQRGISVRLYEMRPVRQTGAHVSDRLAELVCSNSFGSKLPDRASGLLKTECQRLGCLLLDIADSTAVAAGGALAVDREAFAQRVTDAISSHPNIVLIREEMPTIPVTPTIIASGPLTSDALSSEIARLSGAEYLYFYDAISPIVTLESIDFDIAFRANMKNLRLLQRHLEKQGYQAAAPVAGKGPVIQGDYSRVA